MFTWFLLCPLRVHIDTSTLSLPEWQRGWGGLAGREKDNFLHLMTPSSSLLFPSFIPQGSKSGLALSPKLFLSFLFWDHCRFTCSYKKQYREILCISHLVSSNGNILDNSSTVSQLGNWHWYSPPSSSDFISLCSHLCVCVCVCTQVFGSMKFYYMCRFTRLPPELRHRSSHHKTLT